jgi:hypothetical protein
MTLTMSQSSSLSSLEKSRLRRFFRTLAWFPAAKSVVFAACHSV